MLPAFPLEDERDDLEDWFACFRDQMELRQRQFRLRRQEEVKDVLADDSEEGCVATRVLRPASTAETEADTTVVDCDFEGPAMDVIIMVQREEEEEDAHRQAQRKRVIIGGAAVEYYKKSSVGLLSYIVLHPDARGCGLATPLHEEALDRLETLARRYGTASVREQQVATTAISSKMLLPNPSRTPRLRAIFAETNTAAAGDVTPEQSLVRHKFLFRLGYRLVQFPYAQPPLTTKDVNATFDDIVLLVYFPFNSACKIERQYLTTDSDERVASNRGVIERYCPWFLEKKCYHDGSSADSNTVQMNSNIPFQYIEDFYRSVFTYGVEGKERLDHLESGVGNIPDYRKTDYYSLARWFTHDWHKDTTGVVVCLCAPVPWKDCKGGLIPYWKKWQEEHQRS